MIYAEPPIVEYNDSFDLCSLMDHFHRDGIHNIVISPGPGTPEIEEDARASLDVFRKATNVPIFGVCLGFQALAAAHGARIVRAPHPVHGRLSAIHHNDHPLFQGIPTGDEYQVVRYHSLIVDGTTIPECLQPIAWSNADSHAMVLSRENCAEENSMNGKAEKSKELVMGLAHCLYPHYGVQYHPESVASAFGFELLCNFRDITCKHWGFKPKVSRICRMNLKDSEPSNCDGLRGIQNKAAYVDKPEGFLLGKNGWQLCYSKVQGVSIHDIQGGTEAIFNDVILNKVESSNKNNTFWLDSATTDRASFSYLGGPGGRLWKSFSYKIESPSDGLLTIKDRNDNIETRKVGFWEWLDDHLEWQNSSFKKNILPFEFWGGLVGFLGYELKAQCGSDNIHHSTVPDAAFFFIDRFIAVDHMDGGIWVVELKNDSDENGWMDSTILEVSGLANKKSLESISDENRYALNSPSGENIEFLKSNPVDLRFEIREPYEKYIKNIHACMDALYSGDSYELCLTTCLQRKTNADAWKFYKILRKTNPAPYAAWIRFDDSIDVTICSSSPERFLKADMNGAMEAKPIKGTVKRNQNVSEDEDRAAAEALAASEKDRAENLMIVDLLRNDLGRVCVPGTVHVPSLMQIESFATVHQLVSTVRGQRASQCSIAAAVRAAFPGGSMTGAPKLRSMAILNRLENGPRGVYSGSIGYFSVNGAFDLNIVIRTAVFHNSEVTIGAGGAIVVQSDPHEEYAEMRLKASALVKAFTKCEGGIGKEIVKDAMYSR